MLGIICNIRSDERVARILIGILLLLGVYFCHPGIVSFIVGLTWLIQGIVGWCGIPIIMQSIKDKKRPK